MDQNDVVRKNITKFRTEKGYTQERLAYESEISKGYLSEIESGKKSPTVRTMVKLSKTLEVELFKFFK